jgi:putative transposase
MSRRRVVLPGQVLFMDRRTTRRFFLFVPDPEGETEQCFWYCLALAAKEYGMRVHAASLMANHVHLSVTDVRGCYPDFLRRFHRLLALTTKARLGWTEEVFNKAQAGVHERATADSIVKGLAYVVANASAAGLVRRSSEYPGAHTTADDMGRRVIVATRPKHYFRGASWPPKVELRIELPAVLEAELGEREARRRVRERVREIERQALATSKKLGIPFVGARKLQRMRPTRRARSWEDLGSRNPRWAAAGDREEARRLRTKYAGFDRDYDAALAHWVAGDRRRAVFPPGTWWMRVHHGARVRPPPERG